MGNKKIKNLGKRRKLVYRKTVKIRKFFIGILILICLISMYNINRYISDLYKRNDIEINKIEYYMDIADEASDYKTQLNWKEIMAIEMVMYNGELDSIRKRDSLKVAKRFVERKKEKDNYTYKIKSATYVMDEINFSNEQKKEFLNYKKDIDDMYMIDKNLSNDSKQIIFIEHIKEISMENYYSYNILPSITIAQCILESGWGESDLSRNSNNLFGIKADKRWDGESIDVSTKENYDDKIVASFRVYNSREESIRDHGKFLSENKRYSEHGFFDAEHYTTQAQALEDAGYSTKKDDKGNAIYADMLVNLIRNYNLQLIDWEIQLKK